MQFLNELEDEDEFSPGEDTTRFKTLKTHLYVLRKLNKLEDALVVLSSQTGDELKALIYKTMEDMKVKYPDQIELSQQSTKANNILDFSSYAINNASLFILHEFFKTLFAKCIYVLQNYTAIRGIVRLGKGDYAVDTLWSSLEKQIGDLIYSYIVDEDYTKDLNDHDDPLKNVETPFTKIINGDMFSHGEQLFQFAKLRLDDKGALTKSVEFTNALTDIFESGDSKPTLVGSNDSVYIEHEATVSQRNLLVPANVFNMGAIVDYFLFFVGSAYVLFPVDQKEVPLSFFDRFMKFVFVKQLENTLSFQFDKIASSDWMVETNSADLQSGSVLKKFFQSSLTALDTSLYFRESYVNILMKCMNKMATKYRTDLEELVPPEFLKQTKDSLLPLWLSDEDLKSQSRRLMSNSVSRQESDLIKHELELSMKPGPKLSSLIKQPELFDVNKYSQLSQLFGSLSNTLDWLPNLKREVKPAITSETSKLNSLRETWHFSNYSDTKQATDELDTNDATSENFGDTHLALHGDYVAQFTEIVGSLQEMLDDIKLYFRYDMRCKAIFTVTQMYDKDTWMESYQSGEVDVSVIQFNKLIMEINKLLSQKVGTATKSQILKALPDLIDHSLVSESRRIIKMNDNGLYSIFVNIRVLKQMLRNVMGRPEEVDFGRSEAYFEMFKSTDKGILDKCKEMKRQSSKPGGYTFGIEDYKNIVRLVFSEVIQKDTVKSNGSAKNGLMSRHSSSFNPSKRYDDTVKTVVDMFKR
ncbi:unnamed protein product [Ambrosiozyma monospora]|uniref:Exocyst complex component Sec8 n=1 Tax=Ambrosiozyma monospora TaxID=43982 RepID=A0A9W6YZ18_AMBMO|nr:unnamed protein product [Ambrosiozyma monospora]